MAAVSPGWALVGATSVAMLFRETIATEVAPTTAGNPLEKESCPHHAERRADDRRAVLFGPKPALP
jgi:hypothetical protein